MRKYYIGIDNGVSGTMAILGAETPLFAKIPTIKVQDYTKKKKEITRLDFGSFKELLETYKEDAFLVLERPLVNPTRFMASASALRCHEAELIAIEEVGIPYCFCDSKDWQRELLPKGTTDTKMASLEIGKRLFPSYREFKHPDRDALLIAEWARRKNL